MHHFLSIRSHHLFFSPFESARYISSVVVCYQTPVQKAKKLSEFIKNNNKNKTKIIILYFKLTLMKVSKSIRLLLKAASANENVSLKASFSATKVRILDNIKITKFIIKNNFSKSNCISLYYCVCKGLSSLMKVATFSLVIVTESLCYTKSLSSLI